MSELRKCYRPGATARERLPMNGEKPVAFSVPDLVGREWDYLKACLNGHAIAGDGHFTKKCHELLSRHFGAPVLLTHSCTAALEMAAILFDVGPGDEVILPSFTFVSTANAFVLRGAVPVFVDIQADTLNIDKAELDAALSQRTRAVVPVHYAGVGCDMDAILEFAEKNALKVLEDAAQGYLASWGGRPLGSMGHLGALSFHASKNIVAGEGGCSSSTIQRSQSGPRSFVKKAQIARRSRGVRSTSTNGSISARRSCRAISSPPFCWRSSKPPRISRRGGGGCGNAIISGLRRRSAKDVSGGRSYRRRRRATATSTIWSLRLAAAAPGPSKRSAPKASPPTPTMCRCTLRLPVGATAAASAILPSRKRSQQPC